MSLFVIGDLHLSLSTDKPMDVFGGRWENYHQKIAEGFTAVTDDDVVILLGDLSWSMNLQEAAEDFRFIGVLPGKKLIVKGNHDYWWNTVASMERRLAELGVQNVSFLHNRSFTYGGAALCGTRGWFYEEDGAGRKVFDRELCRLRASLEHGAAQKPDEIICFLHYPPLYEGYRCDEIVDMMNEYGVKRCYYGHLHGAGCNKAIEGVYKGIDYRLVSADHISFKPIVVN